MLFGIWSLVSTQMGSVKHMLGPEQLVEMGKDGIKMAGIMHDPDDDDLNLASSKYIYVKVNDPSLPPPPDSPLSTAMRVVWQGRSRSGASCVSLHRAVSRCISLRLAVSR